MRWPIMRYLALPATIMIPFYTATVLCFSLLKSVSAQMYYRPRRTVSSVIAGAIIGIRPPVHLTFFSNSRLALL